MQYICPDLICPYCGQHTYYNIDKVQVWSSRQTCQSCGKIFFATSNIVRKFDLDKDILINYGISKIEGKENG